MTVPSSMFAGLLPERTMEFLSSSIPDNQVRVSFELGEQWFVADVSIDLLWHELDRFTAELSTDGGPSRPARFAWAGVLAGQRAREAGVRNDARAVCLAGLWIVLHRPPDAQAAREFLIGIIERDGRAWIGIAADEDASVASFAFDIAPAHLAEEDVDLDMIELLPARDSVH